MSNSDQSIAIVGAGPVGLSLALALSKKNIPVEVFEKELSLPPEIRASTFHAPTLEKMAQWGVIDQVLEKGNKVRSIQFWDRSQKKVLLNLDYDLIKSDTAYPFRLQCPQNVYAQTLVDHLKSNPLVKMHWGYKFTGLEESEQAVTASFATKDGLHKKTSPLLCAADGSNSAIRQFLKIDFSGMTYIDRFLLIGTQLNLEEYYPNIAPVNYIFDPEEWVIVLNLKNLVRIVFQVPPEQEDAEALAKDNIKNKIWNFVGKKIPFPILHTSIYKVHQRVASQFKKGRCLLLGDAAHINNPASGMGMNSGIMDAALLADKICDYLNTDREDSLLNYEKIRKAYAEDNIKSYTQKRYQDLSTKSQEARQQRNENFARMQNSPELARDYLLKASMLDYHGRTDY